MHPHPASDPNGPAVFDFDRLREMSGGDEEFEREILEEFLDETPETLERLSASMGEGIRSSAQLEAHSIKGASLSVGAEALGAAAYVLEAMLGSEDLDDVVPYVVSLRDEFDRVRRELRQHLDRAA